MQKYAIIVAGGKGLRMGGELPKQFIPIEGRPVLMRTLDTFYAYDNSIQIILVLPGDHQSYWKQLCHEYQFAVPHRIANGGATRFHSVQNGLSLVDAAEALVAVHDGVRPFVSTEVIARCYAEADTFGTAVPALPSVESVRLVASDGSNRAIDRREVMLIQTPQVFNAEMLISAYNQPFTPLFTDDASVVEATGKPIHLTLGQHGNIKLTTPDDMRAAEAML